MSAKKQPSSTSADTSRISKLDPQAIDCGRQFNSRKRYLAIQSAAYAPLLKNLADEILQFGAPGWKEDK